MNKPTCLNMAASNTGHLVDDFEIAFQACLATLTNQDHFNVHDSEEIRSSSEQTLQRFLDMAKHMECFFLQKRLLLSAQKPEQILREEINELKLELSRKDQLIQKHYEKIQHWQNLLSDLQGPGRPPQQQQTQPSQQPPQMSTPVPPPVAPPTSVPTMAPNMQPPQMYGPPPMVQSPMGPPQTGAPSSQAGIMSGLQGPLAYLEKTTSNIGIGEMRR